MYIYLFIYLIYERDKKIIDTLVWISFDLSLSNFLRQIKHFGQWWNIFGVLKIFNLISIYDWRLFSKWDRMTINLSYVIAYFVWFKNGINMFVTLIKNSKWNPLFTFLLDFSSSSYLWLRNLNILFLKLTHFSS